MISSTVAHDLSRPNILIVDDSKENLLALQELLACPNYNVTAVQSGEEALKALLKRDFALILLDVNMPGLNGFETAQFILRREKTRRIPIIFITAFGRDESYVFEGYSSGAVDYILKPVNPVILKSKVAIFVDLFRKNQAFEQAEKRYRELVDSCQAIVWTADPRSFHLNFISQRAEGLLGFPREFFYAPDFLRKHVDQEDVEIVFSRLRQALEEKLPQEFEFRIVAADGRRVWFRNFVRPIETNGTEELLGTMVDITRWKIAEQELGRAHAQLEYRVQERTIELENSNKNLQWEINEKNRALNRLAVQNEISKILSECDTWRSAASRVLRAFCEFQRFDVGILWQYVPEKNVLVFSESWTNPGKKLQGYHFNSRQFRFSTGEGLPGKVLFSRMPMWIKDLFAMPSFLRSRDAAQDNLRSLFAFPILRGNIVDGVIEFVCTDFREPDDQLMQLGAAIGVQIGHFIDRKNLEEGKRTLLRQLDIANQELNFLTLLISSQFKDQVSAISSTAHILLSGYEQKLDEIGQNHIKHLSRNAGKVQELINGVLKYSKGAQIQRKNEMLDLNVVLSAIRDRLQIPSNARITVLAKLPVLTCDPIRVSQILENLLAYVLRALPPEGAEIRIGSLEESDRWTISITLDCVPEESADLELAIARKNAEASGGKFWIEQDSRNSVVYNFTLPKSASSEEIYFN